MVTADMFGPGTLTGTRRGEGPPIPFETKHSTPLDDGTTDGGVPRPLLWALKEHRRIHLELSHQVEGERVGSGDGEVWVIDTGHSHCTAGRLVGKSPDGVTYCLVGTIKGDAYVAAASNDPAAVHAIFSDATHLTLCGVYEGTPSNVMDVRRYRHAGDVPAEFLPPHPPIDFPEDIEPETF